VILDIKLVVVKQYDIVYWGIVGKEYSNDICQKQEDPVVNDMGYLLEILIVLQIFAGG
jgi:hypothetical protein